MPIGPTNQFAVHSKPTKGLSIPFERRKLVLCLHDDKSKSQIEGESKVENDESKCQTVNLN